jgi:nucleoside-diphosphate-sugar epimerase
MRIFMTGASGFIGSAVIAELIGAGHQVVGLARSPGSADQLTALGAGVCRASLEDLGSLRAAASAADGVIHLAYRHGAPAEDAAGTDRRAIETIGGALAGSGRPFVLTSGTLVLPPGRVVTEADAPDPAAPAAARIASEQAGLALAGRGVRVSVVRLAPSVHERVRRGFAGMLVGIAEESGISGYVGDGSQRWPAVHRQDAARLYRLAAEKAPAGSVLHGVGEEGVPLRDIAEVIGARLGIPVRAVPRERAAAHFGWLATIVSADAPASSAATRRVLGWEPSHAGLLDDLSNGEFFEAVQR